MNVSVGKELELFVNEMVASGMYKSKSAVARAAVQLLQDSAKIHRADKSSRKSPIRRYRAELSALKKE